MATRIDANTEFYSRSLSGDAPAFTDGWTMGGWFQINTDRNTYSSWICFYGTGVYWNLATESDGLAMYGFWADGTVARNTSLFTATANTWYFLMAVRPSGASATLTYYHGAAVSGLLTATNSSDGAPTTFTAANFEVGRDGDSGEWLNGTSGPVKIWNRALTANEVNAERWQIAPRNPTGLWGFYPFLVGDGGAAAEADYSTAGRTLTGGAGSASVVGPPVPWRLGRARYSFPTAAGGTTTTPTPVTITGTVTSVSLALAYALAAMSVDGTLVAVGQGINAPPSPIEVLGTVVAPTPSFANTPTAVTSTGTVVVPNTALAASLAAVDSTASVVTPVTALGATVSPESLTATVVAATETFGHAQAAVAIDGTMVSLATSLAADLTALGTTTSVVTTNTALGTSPSPVAITGTVVAVTTTGDSNVALDAVSITGMVPTVATALGAELTAVSLTATVVTASAATSAAPGVSAIILSSAQFAYRRGGQEQFGYVRLYGAKFVYVVQTDNARFSG